LSGGRARPLTGALEEATEFSHDSGETAHPGTAPTEKTEARPQQGGEGIGLSIVKRLAELLDATVEVQTDEGRGTTFRVLIPRRYLGDASP
jgi:signal transduction histidine kinase